MKYLVTDQLANDESGPRTHDHEDPERPGRILRFKFEPEKARECPDWLAMKLATIPGFKVEDENGKVYRSDGSQTEKMRTLEADETIAKWPELTSIALAARCNQYEGQAGKWRQTSAKPEMIAFLTKMGIVGEVKRDEKGYLIWDQMDAGEAAVSDAA